MDEIVDFLASNIIIVGLLGVLILILKLVVVYLLIITKKPTLKLSRKSFKAVFTKYYTADDIKKSKVQKRVFLKKANNRFKIVAYIWMILFVISIFFKITALRNATDAPPSQNSQNYTPEASEE